MVDGNNREFDFHERRIYLHSSGKHVTIGHGLDTIRTRMKNDGEKETVLKDCHITIDGDMSYREYFMMNYAYHEMDLNELPGNN